MGVSIGIVASAVLAASPLLTTRALTMNDPQPPVMGAAVSSQAERCPPEEPADPNRRSTTSRPAPFEPGICEPARLPPPLAAFRPESLAIPDRWRVVSLLPYEPQALSPFYRDLLRYQDGVRDPYAGNNPLKGDRPLWGDDWFLSLTGIADTVVEPRRFPVPVGGPLSARPASLDAFGQGRQLVLAQTLIAEAVLYKGDTVFRPPDYELRFIPVFNFARVEVRERGLLKADVSDDLTRSEGIVGIQGLFIDKHLRDVSTRYDFDSLRVGVQPFNADFRGFLFQDAPLGVRLFGTRANNRYQYNLAWLRRFDKDATTGLNDLVQRGLAALRDDDLWIANFYAQDFPRKGFTSQLLLAHNRNSEGDQIRYDDHGIIQRPASFGREVGSDYAVTYVGANGDGRLGRWNLSASGYFAIGKIAQGAFTTQRQRIRAGFVAAEVSRDFSWLRVRGSALYASGDRDPFDNRAQGFDAINENPLFAGADTSFWIRQPVPLIGGGRVAISSRNGLLNSLRSSKEYGQSNFINPGTTLLGVGIDADLTPQLRLAANVSQLGFADTRVLQVARAQAGLAKSIGTDVSIAATWRPFAQQNVVVRLSAASLLPGSGFKQLYGSARPYSILGNLVLQY